MIAFPTSELLSSQLPAHTGGIEGPWWLAWNADVQVLLPAAILVGLYLRGLRGMERPHRWWQTALFLTGVVVVLAALQSPIDRLGEHHFTFHMLQHELITAVGVPFVLLGAPTTPVLLGLPAGLRQDVIRPLAGSTVLHRVFGFLTHPVVAVLHLLVATVFWHLPGPFDAALRNDLVHDTQHLSFLLGGSLFWWNVIDPAPLRSRLTYPLRIVYLLPGMALRVALGAFLTFSSVPWYSTYLEVRPFIPLTPLEDQQLGGILMWVPGELWNVGIIGILFAVWVRKSQQPAGEVEPLVARRRRIEV